MALCEPARRWQHNGAQILIDSFHRVVPPLPPSEAEQMDKWNGQPIHCITETAKIGVDHG
jgi:hypothetical protein